MSNDLRIPGLNTGMDTQATIDKIMKYSKMPLTRLQQKQQMLIWKQEAYRAQNTALTQLRDLVFNLKLQASYNTKTVSSTNSQAVTATANSTAVNGSYSIIVQQLAEVATNTSRTPVSIRTAVTGNGLSLGSSPVTIDSGAGNNQINVTLDGVTRTLTLTDRVYDGTAGNTLADLVADIQNQLNSAGFADPVYVKANSNNQLVFYSPQDDDLTPGAPHTLVLEQVGADATLTNLGFADQATTKELTGSILTGASVTVTATNNKFKITMGSGAAQEVTLAAGTYNFTDFATEIQTKIQALGGTYANVQVSVNSLNQLRITPTDAAPSSIKLESASSNDVLWQMGFTSGTISEYPKNPIDTTTTFWNQRDKFINTSFFDGKTATSTFNFSINGQAFSFGLNSSLSQVISAINSSNTAGVTAAYDGFNDKLTLTTKKTGDNQPGAEIQITDTDGFLGQLFNIDQNFENPGKNAKFAINNVWTERTENNFTINDVNFTLKGETGGSPAVVTVATDTSGIVAKITDFVNKYNDLISGINTELTESRATSGDKYTFYQPLTDEQRENLSEDEIKAWEDKAKQGILHHDTILAGALSNLRMSLSRNVDTPRVLTGNSLSGTIDLTGSNHFTVTIGAQTREISLTERTYTSSEYNLLVNDLQQKLDRALGTNRIRVALNGSNGLTFTSQNAPMTLSNGSQNNGLGLLGFSDGATVTASYSMLSQIGITTGSYTENGKLHLDTEVLQNALANDPDGVLRLLTNNETITVPSDATAFEKANAKTLENNRKGIFNSFYDTLYAQITKINNEAGTTGTLSFGNMLGQELIQIGEQIDKTQDRITAEENRLWNVFSQMEVAIGQMNNQLNWLNNVLGQGQ